MTLPWRQAQNLFPSSVTRASQRHSESAYPFESVGLVVDNEYIPVKNCHRNPQEYFKVAPSVLIEYEGRIQAIIHSHPEPQPKFPSKQDQLAQQQWGIPFGIQLVNSQGAGNIAWWGDGVPVADYVGRPYIYGIYDCFSIWREYYREELGIHISNVPRNDEFWLNNDNIYADNQAKLGFETVDIKDIKPYDLILIKIRSKIANHGILYLGGDTGLHHLPYKLSSKDIVSRFMDPKKEIFDRVIRYTGI